MTCNMWLMMKALCISSFLLFAISADAQADWAFARDDFSRPIDQTDTIVLSLGTSRLPTEKTFFTHVDEAGVVIQVTVTGDVTRTVNGVGQTNQENAAYPFAFKAPVLDKNRHLVNLPFQGTPVKGLPLNATGTVYRNATFDITMIRVDQGNTWTKIANKLISFAQGASIPASPLGTAAKYAVDFASNAMNDALADAGKDQKFALGSRSLNLRTERRVSTGTYLLILDDTVQDDGYVNPNDLSQVCLYRQIGSGDTIMVGKKTSADNPPGDRDADGCSKASYRALTNPYVPVILERDRISKGIHVLGSAYVSPGDDMQGKLAHCRMANKDEKTCQELFPALLRR